MEIVYKEKNCLIIWNMRLRSPEHPVLIDRYLTGIEIEVDAICDGENVLFQELWNILNELVFTLVIR